VVRSDQPAGEGERRSDCSANVSTVAQELLAKAVKQDASISWRQSLRLCLLKGPNSDHHLENEGQEESLQGSSNTMSFWDNWKPEAIGIDVRPCQEIK
jgi:hypothetical protein